MLENRNSERQLILRTGKIGSIDASDRIDCAVLNMSQSGACLLVPDSIAIAEFFDLVIDCESTVRACRRVWQQGCRIGLAFMDGMEQASHAAE